MAFPLPDKPSIAVLPFVNLSGDATQDYLGEGIADNIITALSRISDMFVIARTSTFTYKGSESATSLRAASSGLATGYGLQHSLSMHSRGTTFGRSATSANSRTPLPCRMTSR